MLRTHVLALSADDFFCKKNVPTSMHSVRLEPTKIIFVGTWATYQATGDADLYICTTHTHCFPLCFPIHPPYVPYSSRSLPVLTQIQGHIAGTAPPSPPPNTAHRCIPFQLGVYQTRYQAGGVSFLTRPSSRHSCFVFSTLSALVGLEKGLGSSRAPRADWAKLVF